MGQCGGKKHKKRCKNDHDDCHFMESSEEQVEFYSPENLRHHSPSDSHTDKFFFKLLLIGDSGVGKSSLLLRFSDNTFEDSGIATINVDFKLRRVKISGEVVKLQIWDTAGQERFRTITSSFYRGAHGIVIVYDISSPASFEHVAVWMKEIKRYAIPNVSTMLVGNKSDTRDRLVSHDSGQKLASELNVDFLETSAKSNRNVSTMFENLAARIKDTLYDS
eukprot:TRINITY_DN928_c2_g3_i2.p1 TRINITY_DN928_c2_g3~~TRINITY_DN928_c2_g3_i2.p1  ORF type:complete len:220 (-),score=41.93 TRINITY_DN928_c2_g3_i2:63-722(-)